MDILRSRPATADRLRRVPPGLHWETVDGVRGVWLGLT